MASPGGNRSRRRLAVFGWFTAAYFLSYFYRSANAVIADDLAQTLHLNANQLGLMTSLFFAAFAAVQIPLGIGLDRWGARWVTPLLMLVGAAGSLLFGLAPGFASLAVGRALIGMGMAGVLMGSLKIFSRWFSEERYATASGLLVGIGATGALFAATPLAWLNHIIGWRAVFLGGGGITACIAGGIMLWTRNAPSGVAWRAHELQAATDPDATDPDATEPDATEPDAMGPDAEKGKPAYANRVDAVFRNRRFWRIAPVGFFLAGGLMGFQGLWAGPYLFHTLGLNAVQTGNVLTGMAVGTTAGYLTSGWIADRFGATRTILTTGILFTLCQFGLALPLSLGWVWLLYIAFGYTGAFNVMVVVQTRQIFPLEMIGKAITAMSVFTIGGTFLMQWCMGLIIGAFPADAAGRYPPEAYSTALICTGVGTALALLWYAPLQRRLEQSMGEAHS